MLDSATGGLVLLQCKLENTSLGFACEERWRQTDRVTVGGAMHSRQKASLLSIVSPRCTACMSLQFAPVGVAILIRVDTHTHKHIRNCHCRIAQRTAACHFACGVFQSCNLGKHSLTHYLSMNFSDHLCFLHFSSRIGLLQCEESQQAKKQREHILEQQQKISDLQVSEQVRSCVRPVLTLLCLGIATHQ